LHIKISNVRSDEVSEFRRLGIMDLLEITTPTESLIRARRAIDQNPFSWLGRRIYRKNGVSGYRANYRESDTRLFFLTYSALI